MILNGTCFNSEKTFWFSEMLLGLLVIDEGSLVWLLFATMNFEDVEPTLWVHNMFSMFSFLNSNNKCSAEGCIRTFGYPEYGP